MNNEAPVKAISWQSIADYTRHPDSPGICNTWALFRVEADRSLGCGGKHPTSFCRRRKCEACSQIHAPEKCEVILGLKRLAQEGQLKGVPADLLRHLRNDPPEALNE